MTCKKCGEKFENRPLFYRHLHEKHVSSSPLLRKCTGCLEEKSKDNFQKSMNNKSFGLSPKCLECCHKRSKAIYENKKDHILAYARRHRKENKTMMRAGWLRREYGITLAEYDSMLGQQNGVCAICENPKIGKPMSVDHDHKTGKVRGLLCQGCNAFLGRIGDSVRIARKIISYLEKNENLSLV